jgi:DNA-binding cell septation regulator SpoVG
MSLEITEFRNFKPQDGEKLKGFIDVVFNDALVVKGFKVIEGSEGLFVAAPARFNENAEGRKWNDIVYFTKPSGMRAKVHEAILEHYRKNIATADAQP